MKRSQSRKVLDQVLHSFAQHIASVQFEAYMSSSGFADAHKEFRAALNNRPAHQANKRARYRQVWTAVPILDLRQADICNVAIGAHGARDEDLLEALVIRYNHQLQWLLATAYEAYEAFFKGLYGALGYLDRNLWRCSDFGAVPIPDIAGKDVPWFQAQARQSIARHNIREVLSVVREKLPAFADKERNNALGYDLVFWIGAIETFRHIVVHSQGQIEKTALWTAIQKKTGHSMQGNKKAGIRAFLSTSGNQYAIWLVSRGQLHGPYHQIDRKLQELLKILGSHAALAYSTALVHFGKQPLWEGP